MLKHTTLPAGKLRWRCRPGDLKFETTAEVEPIEGIVGQERAFRFMRLALGIKAPGYNLFVAGPGGCGRMTAIQSLLDSVGGSGGPPADLCYVCNFRDEVRPRLISLAAGQGAQFAEEMDGLVEYLGANLAALREGKEAALTQGTPAGSGVRSPFQIDLIRDMRGKYSPEVDGFLSEVERDIARQLDRIGRRPSTPQSSEPNEAWGKYRVHVVVDNSGLGRPPVVYETAPSYSNLFGSIDSISHPDGLSHARHMDINVGSLVAANGGYLILQFADVLTETGVWPALRRSLREGKVELFVRDADSRHGHLSLRPEAIPIDVKVVMLGDADLYQEFYEDDDDFGRIFKVRADFIEEMERTPETVQQYARFVRSLCDSDKLLPFHHSAVASLVEEGVRIAGRQNKITTRFGKIADLVREADYWAREAGRDVVAREDMGRAISQRVCRLRVWEDRIQELIEEGQLLIETQNTAVGQVNGLTVFDMGDYSFARPTRITARVGIGRAGIISIDREAEFSGKAHNKGVLILAGYLRGRYAVQRPIAMSASVVFEQTYSEVDGDSASTAEIYAILSALAEVPLAQEIAVTGSIGQTGEVQPIDQVNEKVEGFFEVCKAAGLTGRHGVIIPARNASELMLREEVVSAVEAGQFHIYAIRFVEEGLRILTGKTMADRQKDGTFAEGSIDALIDMRLEQFAQRLSEYIGADGDEQDGEG